MHLEVGRSQVFAYAWDRPGWCRRGREASLQALRECAPRYFRAVQAPPPEGAFELAAGTPPPDSAPPAPRPPGTSRPPGQELARLAGLAGVCRHHFDPVAGSTSGELSRGPRGRPAP